MLWEDDLDWSNLPNLFWSSEDTIIYKPNVHTVRSIYLNWPSTKLWNTM